MEVIVCTTTGALKPAPRLSERLAMMFGVKEVSQPRSHVTYTSPLGPTAGSEPCTSTPWRMLQLEVPSSTATGAPKLRPPSCEATTSIRPHCASLEKRV